MIYSCMEDYDMAIDDFILEHQTFPIIEEDKDHFCAYCKEKSAYRLVMPGTVAEKAQDMV